MSKGKILLGVTGGIAAYKACELTSLLTQKGYEVTVIMTRAGTRFVTPLTFRTLSKQDVFTELFPEKITSPSLHISLAERGEILVIAPATANFIGKLANGIADDLLTTVAISFRGPLILAPAMNDAMFKNKIVQGNIKRLQKLGIKIIMPEKGYLACGYEGEGRLANPEAIIKTIFETLQKIQKKRIA